MEPIAVQLDKISPVSCPCGTARRVMLKQYGIPVSIHLTDIQQTAQPHYHDQTTEVYVVLECSVGAYLEINGVQLPLQALTMVVVPPKSVHRLVGEATILLIAHPEFTVEDEVVLAS